METAEAAHRADEISAAAAAVLRGRGFASVGIDEIAAAAGLTGPALYRYFAGKNDVLADVIGRFLGTLSELPDGSPARLAELVVSQPDSASVTVRQLSALGREPARELVAQYPQRVRQMLPDPDTMPAPERVRMRALYGAAIHCGLHRGGTLTARQRAARRAAEAIGSAPIDLGELAPERPAGLLPQSRREAVMTVAMELFSEHGYGGVSLRDIGNVLGVTASAVSRHFPSKEDLLVALLDRGSAQISGAFQSAFRKAVDADDAINRLLRGYSAMAVDSRELILIYTSERNSLSEANRQHRRGHQRGYAAELRHLLQLRMPTLSRGEAQLRATLAFSVINEVLFDEELCRYRELAPTLAALARTAIVTPQTPAGAGRTSTPTNPSTATETEPHD